VRSRLRLVALVVPTLTVYYQISPAEYFGFGKPDAQGATLARRINNIRLLCIRGRDERMSLCPELAEMPNVPQIVLPGGHPLQRTADRLYGVLRRAIETSATSQLR